MGLTIFIDGQIRFEMLYSRYSQFIQELVEKAYGPECLKIFKSIYERPMTSAESDFWNMRCNDDLDILIQHPDDRGDISPENCRKIYEALKPYHLNALCRHQNQYVNVCERWKEMLLYCARNNAIMEYR